MKGSVAATVTETHQPTSFNFVGPTVWEINGCDIRTGGQSDGQTDRQTDMTNL
ncbi:hypothetical protein SFRURICE_000875 [Spodoptera frugiperda]|nr:hypothetical protein SFRURICE_000875 [Spodoptera frugiperda]